MTTLDTASVTSTSERRKALVDRLVDGTPYAVAFGGQGAPWVEPLADIVRDFALEAELESLVEQAEALVAPVGSDLVRSGVPFTPLAWIDVLAAGESAEDDDAPALPDPGALAAPAASIPGILLTQLAGLRALRRQGLDPHTVRPVAAVGHSQGVLAVEALAGTPDAELLAYARLIGAATQVVGRRRGLLGDTMLNVSGESPERVRTALADLPDSARVVMRMRNGRRSVVLSGPEDGLARATSLLEDVAERERADRERKITGGAPFAPVLEPIATGMAYHHPDLADAADLAAAWAEACGLDAERARTLTMRAVVDPIDWVEALESVMDAGARWVIDLGPADIATRLSARELRIRGVGVIAAMTRAGHRSLTAPGATPRIATPWSAYAPAVVTLPDGSLHAETRFSRLTGRSPILLAGMTPTTVDPAIVAAAANAGFWTELAGGGQVSEPIFTENVGRLDAMLDPGRTYAFNTLFLDPYLWKLQIGGQRLVQRARAAGSAVDAVIVTAGIPELDEAVALVEELREVGIEHVVFKPGTVKQIRQVVAIADAVAPLPLIVQIEGGKAGGHHSWEDLDELLLSTYAELRAHDNVVVCVGGGVGTPDVASAYITGTWAHRHGYPTMPLDGVLVATAAMATLEATTAPEVKQLLVDTPGTPDWIGSGTAVGGMASSRSQLGADIHEIDNTASRTGRLLDEVAGDAEAIEARRDEIIEALNRTSKPYFGEVAAMTYGQWLARFLELSGRPAWLDVTLRDRFHAMLQRAEARLSDADRGSVPTLFAAPADVEDGAEALSLLLQTHPAADEVVLHPADVSFFVAICKRVGKPVNFVPVIDADLRRWWRSDSLWQAHEARYAADGVCVIPGPVSVAGITGIDEPVADLLRRFEAAVVDDVVAAGRAPLAVDGRRRVEEAHGPVGLVLAAPDVVWAGRTVRNPVQRLGSAGLPGAARPSGTGWVMVTDGRAEHPETGAVLASAGDDAAVLSVPLTRAGDPLAVRLEVGDQVATGGAPIVTTDDAAAAMRTLTTTAAGGLTPTVDGEHATLDVVWDPDLLADHAGVVGVEGAAAVPDALVGLAWPAVFAVVAAAVTPDGHPVVEGMLDLVHLDHAVDVTAGMPESTTELTVAATCASVADTELGRVLTVDVDVSAGAGPVATLVERFAVRGRPGALTLADPVRAGGTLESPTDTPRRSRAQAALDAPEDMRAFAAVTGDHNPIHTSLAAARLAGLGAPIVHGMWISAAAQRVLATQTGRRVTGWTSRFLSPVRPGARLDVRADRVGLDSGDEVVDVTCRVDGEVVMAATARLAAPRTAYVFPGQGIQHLGMGMAGYQRSKAARAVWDRADRHTREALGFSILAVVRENPTTIVANGTSHRHPDGVLFLTQFTQVAMAVLGAAQMAELREAGAFVEGSVLAGHSVGEYNALAAVSGVIPLEAVVEVVFQRGSVMHTLVPRDAEGRSDYRLAAIRPSQIGLADADVRGFVEEIAEHTGEFLEIANYNLKGSQYAIAGTVAGLAALEAEIDERRAAFGGKAAFILVPGIDVPFHSRVLRGGVPDFRDRLEELLPASIDPTILTGRYVPNLVPQPFSLNRDFLAAIAELAPDGPLDAVLADFDAWAERPGELCRLVLIELLAWQFASPVRWIETQDLMFAGRADGGLGIERLVEIGVGSAPTVANLASSTLQLPSVQRAVGGPVQVLNSERDAAVLFATDEEPVVEDDDAVPTSEPTDPAVEPVHAAAPAGGVPSATAGPRPDDLSFDAADGTRLLIAWWTKLRLDQIGPADSIESLCDGVSSRRNQLLVDLGGELGLGAIDGAAEADIPTLSSQVTGLARTYKPFGPVLGEALADHLKKVLGPTGRKQSAVTERVTDTWQLGPGWAKHVTAELALATRDGSSVRGGELGTLSVLASGADVDAAVDASVQAVAARHGVTVDLPSAGGGEATVDAAALAEITGAITGADGVLASTARHLLGRLGLDDGPATPDGAAGTSGDDAQSSPAWRPSSAATGCGSRLRPSTSAGPCCSTTAGPAPARTSPASPPDRTSTPSSPAPARSSPARRRWWALRTDDPARRQLLLNLAEQALIDEPGAQAGEVAVVTGASRGSIAAAVVGRLLAEGATVVATTSSLDDAKMRFFRQLYRANARSGATLWVAPANMASFTDVDALVEWITTAQTRTVGSTTSVVKPALAPTMLFPFAAGRVTGDLTDAGSRAEVDTRILLWSVERLIGRFAAGAADHDIAATLHVVLPGSPNRGMFGGDGAYGEAKAALDAIVAKWRAERDLGRPGHARPRDHRVGPRHRADGWQRPAGRGRRGSRCPHVVARRHGRGLARGVHRGGQGRCGRPAAHGRPDRRPRRRRARPEGPRGRRGRRTGRHHRAGRLGRHRGSCAVTGSAPGHRCSGLGRGHGPSRGPGGHRGGRRARPPRLGSHPVRDGGRRGALRRRRPGAGLEHRPRDLGRQRGWLVRHRERRRDRGVRDPRAVPRHRRRTMRHPYVRRRRLDDRSHGAVADLGVPRPGPHLLGEQRGRGARHA